MVDVTPLVKTGAQIIQSYADGHFRVSGEVYETAVIVMPDRVTPWSVKGPVSDLVLEDFLGLAKQADEIDVVLLGCGPQISFLPRELRSDLKERGLNVEVMDTGAACRTYNVLMAEGRRVAAALLPV